MDEASQAEKAVAMALENVVGGDPGRTEGLELVHPRINRWAQFDPPLRDPSARGCQYRTIYCRTCGEVLGATDDPLDACLIAWRHHREVRRRSRRRVAPASASFPDSRAS